MPQYFPYDVFLSHSSADKTVVRELAERLRADGLKVWFDEWEIKAGDSIPAKIDEALEHSRVLILCMSAHAFGSDWARLESYTYRFKDPLNKENHFIPLRLDHADIKGTIQQFSYIDWRGPGQRDEEYTKLLGACRPPKTTPTAKEERKRKDFEEKIISLGHTEGVNSVVCSPDGHRALSGADDHTIRLWDVDTGECLRVLEGHSDSVRSVAWSPDGHRVFSGSGDTTLRLWDVDTGECLRILEGHSASVRSVAWSPDGHRALSGSDDKTLRLWDVDTGQCLRVLEGHSHYVWSVAWSPDGHCALSGSSDKTLRL